MAARQTLSREEKRALLNHHMGLIRGGIAAVDTARIPLDEARTDLTALIDAARTDLGKKSYTRGYLMELANDTKAKLRDQGREEVQRYEDRQDLSLPVVGDQLLLSLNSDTTPDAAKDEIYWEAHGYAQGRRAADRSEPDGCPPTFETVRLRGYDAGQTEQRRLFGEGLAIKKRLAQPDAGAAPVDLNAKPEEPEPGSPEAKAAERKAVAKVKEGLANLGKAPAAAPAAKAAEEPVLQH